MNIRLAESAGFCFGVRRATDALEHELAAHPDREICTLGRIIHNDSYVASLERRGVRVISRDDVPDIIRRADAGERITVTIRAHGELFPVVSALEECASRNENFTLLDCTCPYVRKVRQLARENSGEGKLFILIGSASHPEVEGIMSCTLGDGAVLADSAAVSVFVEEARRSPPEYEKLDISVAAQTTQKTDEWKKSIKILKKVYTNARIFDTICSVTESRQAETRALAAQSDVVIVIGSQDSSNSCKLRDISREECKEVYFIGDASECPTLSGDLKVSITAGASTPNSLIQEVYKTMNEQNFAELLESSFKTLNTGEIVEGVVTSISQNEIHLDLGAKTTGVIVHDKATANPQAKLADLFKVGDVVKAKVVKVSDIDGIATLDKTRVDSEANWDKIVAACDAGETVEGEIVEAVKGGVIMSVDSVRVFVPASLTGVPRDGDLQSIVGTKQKAKIIEIKPERKRAFASIRAILSEERKAKVEQFWNTVAEGMEFDGEVKRLTDFGAFVDLGGVDGLVHTSELSWKRIRHPKEVVSEGEVIHVYVKSLDREKGRISLGYKTDEMNPWTIFTNKYAEGDVAEVKIVSLLPFGAFAEIIPGCDGLIHISQIADHKIAKPDEVLEVGQVVSAKITAIDQDNHKVSLSIRALLEDNASDEEYADEAVEEAADEAAADAE